jgi:dihydrolipoamide dehydrogenase
MLYDVVVIGSGPGGYKAAITAAHLGAKVALIEKGLAGGTCLNQGCIPKKTLLHLASLIEDVNDLQGRGLVGKVTGDFHAAVAHKNAVIAGIRDNFSVWLKRLGIQVYWGQAKLEAGKRVRISPSGDRVQVELSSGSSSSPVGDELILEASRIILATGSRPKELPNCPTDGHRIMNSRDFMFSLEELPESVLCVGAGPIGVELGYLMHQFGAKVRIVEQADHLLPKMRIPERAGGILERKFKRIGIDVGKGISVANATVVEDGVDVTFTDGSRGRYDRLLIAVGREPVSDQLGLEEVGVVLTDDGFVQTNDYLETNIPGIYAIGDVKPGPMTANAALHDAKVAAANAVKGNELHPNYFKVPVVIHSAFEIAAVGLTEDQAEDAGFEVDVARSSLGGSGKARAHHDFEGFIEVVHDGETGQLLGGCIVGPEAGEQIHMLSAACQSTRGLWFLKDMSYSHPSWCEELETAVDPYTSAFAKSGKEIFSPGIYASS